MNSFFMLLLLDWLFIWLGRERRRLLRVMFRILSLRSRFDIFLSLDAVCLSLSGGFKPALILTFVDWLIDWLTELCSLLWLWLFRLVDWWVWLWDFDWCETCCWTSFCFCVWISWMVCWYSYSSLLFILSHDRNELDMLTTGPGGTSSLLLVVTSQSLLLILSHRVIWTRRRLLLLRGRLELRLELSKTRSSLRKKSKHFSFFMSIYQMMTTLVD